MPRFAGIKDDKIHLISSVLFDHKGYHVLEIPKEFDNISAAELIANFRFKNNELKSKSSKKNAREMKVALVSNYGTKCGIGTYSKFLYDELIGQVGDYKLFIEKQENFSVENPKIPSSKILPCWKRGESLGELVDAIKEYDPDIILVQHEFGIFPNARYWISFMSQLADYRVIITQHSVFYHKDKVLVEACMPEIVVHLEGAKEVLKEHKQLNANVYVIPHGCFPCEDKTKYWNCYKSEHTFVQFGFLFRYKGYENSIKAAAILKSKYPDVYFTGLCSESDYSKFEHQIYYNELAKLIDELELHDNVGIIRGFQSEFVINSYLRINKVAVFPYVSSKEHECFGSSGAAPYTMTKAIPVISSSTHHFKSLPTIKANTPEEIAEELDRLFSNKAFVKDQIEKQNQYLEENSWKNTAKRYIDIFEASPIDK
jgi:glycosyltransferase involved in cell wall biosynthesis